MKKGIIKFTSLFTVVQMYAYKKIKQNGVSFSMISEYTKVKTGKTK